MTENLKWKTLKDEPRLAVASLDPFSKAKEVFLKISKERRYDAQTVLYAQEIYRDAFTKHMALFGAEPMDREWGVFYRYLMFGRALFTMFDIDPRKRLVFYKFSQIEPKCVYCGEPAPFRCIFPIEGSGCERNLCADCTQNGASGTTDFCREHFVVAKAAYEKRTNI